MKLQVPSVVIFASLLSLVPSATAAFPEGTITAPANGTKIAPGAAFNFTYNTRADFCLSSYAYNVYLVTSANLIKDTFGEESTGFYFGRYSEPSTESAMDPAFPPAPAQLTMPDFSKYQGGGGSFGSGTTATNQQMWLVVEEEYSDCSPTLGFKYIQTANHVVYNATA